MILIAITVVVIIVVVVSLIINAVLYLQVESSYYCYLVTGTKCS